MRFLSQALTALQLSPSCPSLPRWKRSQCQHPWQTGKGLSQPGTAGCCGITLVSAWPGPYSQDGNGGGSLPLSGTSPSFSVPKPATVVKACLVLLPGQGCKSSARAVLRYLLLDLLSAKITGVSCFFPDRKSVV